MKDNKEPVKDTKFYIECLKLELIKPLNQQDFMYMRFLDEMINDKSNT